MAAIAAIWHGVRVREDCEDRIDRLAARAETREKALQRREHARLKWSPLRKRMDSLLHSHWFEGACGAIILFNMVLVIIETDLSAKNDDPPPWLKMFTRVLLGIYTCELVLKLYACRLWFFTDMWNILDFLIVGVDLSLLVLSLVVDELPSVSILRVFRLVRLARAVKAAEFFHELHSIIRSFECAMKAIFWGMSIVLLALILWGIMAVQLIHPVNQRVVEHHPNIYDGCSRCNHAFASVFDSALTFWKQLVAGDSWGQVSEPIIEEAPWTSVFFFMAGVTVNVMLLNLILAVIVEAGAAAAAQDERAQATQKAIEVGQAEEKLIDLCRGLDSDGSGSLTIHEFMNGVKNNEDFKQCLAIMNITEPDLHMVFNICDEDDSGDISYREFVEQIRRIKYSGEKMLLHYVTDIRHMVHKLAPSYDLDDENLRTISTPKRSIRSMGRTLSTHSQELPAAPCCAPPWDGSGPGCHNNETEEKKIQPEYYISQAVPYNGAGTSFPSCPRKDSTEKHVGSTRTNSRDMASSVTDMLVTDKIEKISQMNTDLVAMMTDVAKQTEAHTQILNTLVDDTSTHSKRPHAEEVHTSTNRWDSQSQHQSLCCSPLFRRVGPQTALLRSGDPTGIRVSGQMVQPSSWVASPTCIARKV